MLPALATQHDLEARLGLDPDSLTGPDLSRALAALDDASALVREEARQSWVATTGAVEAPDAIVRVVLGAALRTFRNPEGEISTTVGPFSRTIKSADSGVYLTEAELAIVRRYRARTTGLWTLATTRGEAEELTEWMEDSFGFEPFPIGTKGDIW